MTVTVDDDDRAQLSLRHGKVGVDVDRRADLLERSVMGAVGLLSIDPKGDTRVELDEFTNRVLDTIETEHKRDASSG